MDGTTIAAELLAIIGIILIFTILKICQHLGDISRKLDQTNSLLENMQKKSE